MRKMERQINITYRWWRSDRRRIKPDHVECLEETAMARILSQRDQGMTSGELSDNIRRTSRDPEDGIEYSGYWEVKEA